MPSLHTPEEVEAIGNVRSYPEAADVAKAVANRLHANGTHTVYQVCGPISTGGRGSREANMKYFSQAIDFGIENGLVIFDQRPFESVIKRLSPEHTETSYDLRILTDFYEPLFRSGRVGCLLFLPGWETSRGARWERQMGRSLGLRVEYYPFDF